MIRILNKYSFLVTCLFVTIITVAAEGEPPPPAPASFGVSNPPPPGLPIDNNLFVLFVFGLLFGFYKIYVFAVKNKRPV